MLPDAGERVKRASLFNDVALQLQGQLPAHVSVHGRRCVDKVLSLSPRGTMKLVELGAGSGSEAELGWA